MIKGMVALAPLINSVDLLADMAKAEWENLSSYYTSTDTRSNCFANFRYDKVAIVYILLLATDHFKRRLGGYRWTMNKCECFSCAGVFPDIDGPVHRYMNSTPGCWATYGEILAREYSDRTFFEVHRLTVDAYAIQHPGSNDRQSIQSVGVHLIRLCLFLEHGLTPENANDAMLAAGKNKTSFYFLKPPKTLGSITTADVVREQTVQGHKAAVREWAQEAWNAWSQHHGTIRSWLPNK